MRTQTLLATTFVALLTACGGGGSSIAPSQPQASQSQSQAQSQYAQELGRNGGPPHYKLVVLTSLGGSLAAGISDSDQGWISGYSLLSDNATVHAALWADSTTATDLGTLGGTNSAVEWPNHGVNQVVGIAQTTTSDPLGEQWSCSYPAGGGFIPYTGQECRGFLWRDGHMISLGTLGGNNSFAAGANLLGQPAGWAETSEHDPTCVAPQVLQFEGVTWDFSGNAHALAPLAGDSDSAATAINDLGDVVGISGICQNAVGNQSAAHTVMWAHGVPMSLGTLGGAAWNTPEMINDLDQVVGFSDLAGDDGGANFNAHAFLWTRSNGIKDLGTVGSDQISFAYSINDEGQIAGQSCGTAACATSRATLDQNGTMYDLNTLLTPSSSTYYLVFANDINDLGQITGLATDSATGAAVAYELIPVFGPVPASATRSAPQSLRNVGLHLGPFGRMIPQIP
jgi:probable HAF family extracellular repeat protein